MKLHEFNNYNEYKEKQIQGNKKKLNRVWVNEKDITLASEYIKDHINNIKFGICHGTRRGLEQKWFSEQLKCKVIGTEISPTANKFPNTIQWDFHDVKNEWINNVDFIYSNSFDHSYKPNECFDTWMSCLKIDGILILEWAPEHNKQSEYDPFAADINEYREMIKNKNYYFNELNVPGTNRILLFIHKIGI